MDILGDYSGFVGVEEVQLDFWSDDFLMRQAVLDISDVDGFGSPVFTKVFGSFRGYGEPVSLRRRRLRRMRVSLLLLDELEFLQPVGLGGPELPVQGCPGRR